MKNDTELLSIDLDETISREPWHRPVITVTVCLRTDAAGLRRLHAWLAVELGDERIDAILKFAR